MDTTKTTEEAAIELAKRIMCELDTGGSNYMLVRGKIAKLSGVSAMAISFDEHVEIIAKQLDRLKKLEAAYAGI